MSHINERRFDPRDTTLSDQARVDCQWAFDTVCRHVAQQGGPAISGLGLHCMRRADGRRSALGALIDDAEYMDHTNHTALRWVIDEYPQSRIFKIWSAPTGRPFLQHLINVDDDHTLDLVLERLHTLAHLYSLDATLAGSIRQWDRTPLP